MGRQGVNATSMRDVVQHTSTPRGSIAFHFPGGKLELMKEAIRLADSHVSEPLRQFVAEKGTVAGVKAFVDTWRRNLVASDFSGGCPIMAAAVESYVGEKADEDVGNSEGNDQPLQQMAYNTFAGWQEIIAQSLRRDGLPPARARRVAALVVSSIEGGIALSRSARDLRPLDDVYSELESMMKSVIQDAVKPSRS